MVTEENIILRELVASSIKRNSEVPPGRKFDGVRWNRLLRAARRGNVVQILYHALSKNDGLPDMVPSRCREYMRKAYYSSAAAGILTCERAKPALDALRSSNVRFAVLKGAYLADCVYANPALRPFGDVDILVDIDDMPEVDALLKSAGFRSPFNRSDYESFTTTDYLNSVVFTRKNDEGWTTLHIHWHIVNSTVPVRYRARLHMDEFLDECVSCRIGGVEARALAPHHLLLHLCEHLFRHSYQPLMRFCDIACVVERLGDSLNRASFVKTTVSAGMQGIVFIGLRLTRDLLGTALPDGLLPELKPKAVQYVDGRILRAARHGTGIPNLKYLTYLLLNRTIAGRVGFVARSLLPPRDVMALRLGIPLDQVTPGLYLGRLLRGAVRTVDTVRNPVSVDASPE